MEASHHSLLAACFTLHSINATLVIVPQRGAGLWIRMEVNGISYKELRTIIKMKNLSDERKQTIILSHVVWVNYKRGFGLDD
jgi:hypothetical protein